MNNRLVNIDKLKVIATILVVYIHSYNIIGYSGIKGYRNIIVEKFALTSNIAVPIFFFCSAYLLFMKDFELRNNIHKKVLSLLLPYGIWIGGYTVLDIALNGTTTDIVQDVIGIPFYEPPVYSPFWFVRDLFILNLLAGGIKKFLQKAPTVISLAIIGGGGGTYPCQDTLDRQFAFLY